MLLRHEIVADGQALMKVSAKYVDANNFKNEEETPRYYRGYR